MYGSRRAERPNQAMAVESGWGPDANFSGRWPWPHNTNEVAIGYLKETDVAAMIEVLSAD